MKYKKLFILIPGILSLFSLSACNEESYSYIEDDDEARVALANYNYKFDSETKEVTLKEYKGNPGEVEIPGVVGTYTVNKIGAKCFKGKGITKLTIPDTIVYIGNSAFVYNNVLLENRIEKRLCANTPFLICVKKEQYFERKRRKCLF